jgi:hypothetical protein
MNDEIGRKDPRLLMNLATSNASYNAVFSETSGTAPNPRRNWDRNRHRLRSLPNR